MGHRFGGLQAVKALTRGDLDVMLLDRNNHHPFQPLSYGPLARARLDVTPLLPPTVVGVHADSAEIRSETGATVWIPPRTLMWAAGVEASPLV